MTGSADRWIRRTTIGCVGILAVIVGTVSYLHMHLLVELHGQPGWVAALTPLSVDGMIVAASTTRLAESRSGTRGGTRLRRKILRLMSAPLDGGADINSGCDLPEGRASPHAVKVIRPGSRG